MKLCQYQPLARETRLQALHKAITSRLEPDGEKLSPQQVAAFQGYYNTMLARLDGLHVSADRLEGALPLTLAELEVERATEPDPQNDARTLEVKEEYRSAQQPASAWCAPPPPRDVPKKKLSVSSFASMGKANGSCARR
ncbi:MAG: hypothetical protein U0931_14270 [Vulcanimicrobiota bacterium]